MPTIARENHDNLNATVTLSIPATDYQPEFQAQLNKYRQNAHMKGFRKGKTPLSVIRKMYGKQALVELINQKVGAELDQYIKSENLDLLGHPIPAEDQAEFQFDTKQLEDFVFKFDLGLAPEFEVTGLEDTAFNRYNPQVPDAMVDSDLTDAQKRLGVQGPVEDEIQAEDIVKVQADELADGRIKENGWANEFSISVPEMTEEGKALFLGKKKGDLVQFDIFKLSDKDEAFVKKYFLDVNEDAEDNPEIGNTFQALITEVTRATPAELDQAFFDKYFGEGKVTSEAEARETMKNNIKMYYDRQADAFLFKDIKETLEEKNKLQLPEEFLKRWMVASGNLPKGKTADEEIGNLVEGLSWTLIRGKLAKKFEVKVEEAEIKQRLRMQMISYFGGQDFGSLLDDYVEKMMADEQQYHGAYTQVLSDKLFNAMKDVITINENDISTEDLEKLVAEENAKNQPAPEPTSEVEEGVAEAEVIEE